MKIRQATQKQIEYGLQLGLRLKSKSFRVADAMIADKIEKYCLDSIRRQKLKRGDRVRYVGSYKERVNKIFTINTIGKYGLVYFFVLDQFGNKKSTYAYAYNLKKV